MKDHILCALYYVCKMIFYVAQTIYVCKMTFYIAQTIYVCKMIFNVAQTRSQNCHLMNVIRPNLRFWQTDLTIGVTSRVVGPGPKDLGEWDLETSHSPSLSLIFSISHIFYHSRFLHTTSHSPTHTLSHILVNTLTSTLSRSYLAPYSSLSHSIKLTHSLSLILPLSPAHTLSGPGSLSRSGSISDSTNHSH